jgi:hypothetical protein
LILRIEGTGWAGGQRAGHYPNAYRVPFRLEGTIADIAIHLRMGVSIWRKADRVVLWIRNWLDAPIVELEGL